MEDPGRCLGMHSFTGTLGYSQTQESKDRQTSCEENQNLSNTLSFLPSLSLSLSYDPIVWLNLCKMMQISVSAAAVPCRAGKY